MMSNPVHLENPEILSTGGQDYKIYRIKMMSNPVHLENPEILSTTNAQNEHQ